MSDRIAQMDVGIGFSIDNPALNKLLSNMNDLSKKAKEFNSTMNNIAMPNVAKAGREMNSYQNDISKIMDKVTGLNNTVKKLDNNSGFDKLKNKLKETDNVAKETHRSFKKIFLGTAFVNYMSNAFSNMGTQIKSAYNEGMHYNAVLGKINSRFKSMDLASGTIQKLDSQIKLLKYHTNMTGEEISNVQAKMINWSTIGTTNAMNLTKTIAGVADSSKLSGEKAENLASSLMRVGANGKVSYSALSRVTKYAPTLFSALAKGAGLSEVKLREVLKTGNVSQKQFQKWMANAAKYSNSAFSSFDKTQSGAKKRMAERWSELKGIMTKPLFDAKSSGLQMLSDLMGSSELKSGANSIAKGINGIISAVYKHKQDILVTIRGLMDFGGQIGKGVWQDASSIFITIGKSFGLISNDAEKHGGALHAVGQGISNLAKNKIAVKTISDAIIAMTAIKTTKAIASPFTEIAKHGFKAAKNVEYFVKGLKGIENVEGIDQASAKILKSGNKYRDIGKKLGSKFSAGFYKSLFGEGTEADKLKGLLQPLRSVKSFKNLTMAGKIGTGLAGAGVALDAGSSFLSAFKNINSADKRSQDIGKGIGSGIGGGIGLWFGGPLGAAIGAKIGGDIGKWGGQAVNKFTKGWQSKKPPKKFWSMENLGWSAHDMTRKTYRSAVNAQHSLQKGWQSKKPPKKFWSIENLGWVSHQIWNHSIIATVSSGMSALIKGWQSKKPPKKFWSLENLGWSIKSMFGGFIDGVNRVLKWFYDKWHGMSKWFGKKSSDFNKWANNIGSSPTSSRTRTIRAHASGGNILTNHVALVGEGGAELAYEENGAVARLLGSNGPEITKVHAREHILNARDTQKLMHGGLGKGITLKGFAKGTDSLGYAKTIADNSKYEKYSVYSNSKFNKAILTNTKKSFKKRVGYNKLQFKQLENDTGKSFKKLRKSWSKSWTDITHDFRKILNRLIPYTSTSMSGVIEQINRGFKGINVALGQFGGNNHVLSMARYANGTDGPVKQPHLAMLNDSPRRFWQEAIVHSNGSYELPKGKKTIRLLQKGDSVLNGEDTFNAQRQGLLPYYSNGKNSHQALISLAEHNAKNYQQGFNFDFISKIKSIKSRLQQGLTDLNKKAAKSTGYKWYQAMYTFINSIIDGGAGGSREAFLKYAKEHFYGKRYVMGATGPNAYDCSGMVAAALQHFGIDIGRTTVAMQESSGVRSLGHDFNKVLPGDLVIYGHGGGASGHVGIINNKANHTMFNETPPSARVTSIDAPKSMGYEYFRINGLHNSSSNNSIPKKLTDLVKKQLGSRAINWIKNNLSEDALGNSFNLTGDIGYRARLLARALMGLDHSATKNGIAAILGNWFFESGLNTGARNSSGGASGLGQWLGSRLVNLKSFAKNHGKSWTNPAVQLRFALSGEGTDSSIFRSILEGHGSVADLASRFSSEWERGGFNAQHINGAMQIAKSLRGLKNGGHVAAGETVKVNEDGIEMFRPDISGTVIPHSKTVKNIKNNSKNAGNITINQTISVHAEGSDSNNIKAKVKEAVDKANEKMFEKLQENMGFNDDGGLII